MWSTENVGSELVGHINHVHAASLCSSPLTLKCLSVSVCILQGIYWALACIWLAYDDIKIPHVKGEPFAGNSSYVPFYTDYMPVEFFVNGIVSASLTLINVICIFITATIVLKIKEVAAPYTSSADLRRYENQNVTFTSHSITETISTTLICYAHTSIKLIETDMRCAERAYAFRMEFSSIPTFDCKTIDSCRIASSERFRSNH